MLLMCQNAMVQVYVAWIGIYYALCSKTYNTFGGLFYSPAGSRKATRGTRICETPLSQCVTLSHDNTMFNILKFPTSHISELNLQFNSLRPSDANMCQ